MNVQDQVASIDVERAARRLVGTVRETPLVPLSVPDPRVSVHLKLECLQETGSFKARGAWNQLSQLDDDERARGVVASSSGNHGRAVAWAARRAGVRATIFMPENVYPNKLAACRDEGAEVILAATRAEVEERCAEAVARGAVLVHPYDAVRTAEGAGTVGLEIARAAADVEVVLFPVGGGGLIGGSSLAIARELGDEVCVIGVEPEGSPNLTRALDARRPVVIEPITTAVQGLCPMDVGWLNLALAERFVEGTVLLDDEEIFAAQRYLLRHDIVAEPAGSAATGAVLCGALPDELLEGRDEGDPLRVVCVVSGGNADPAQLEAQRARAESGE